MTILLVYIHGLRMPNEAFFIEILNLGRQFGQIKFGVFLTDLTAPIFVLWYCPCFSLINHYFYKNLSLYIQIPNIYLELELEFGPQRIRDLAIVLVCAIHYCQVGYGV